jgi:hypothetical protein
LGLRTGFGSAAANRERQSACLEPGAISERLVRELLIEREPRKRARMLNNPLTLPIKLNGNPNGIFHFLR